MLNTPFDCFIERSKNQRLWSTVIPVDSRIPIVTCPRDELAVSITRGHSSAWFGYRALRQPETNAVYIRAHSTSNRRKKKKKNRSSTLVFALRRRHTRAPHLKARPHAPRVINTQVIRECRTDEEDRWAEAWFFLVIKNYAPRPVCVKARGFVNIFRPVYAFGLAKRRDKVSAYFPGSPLGYHPNGTKPLSLLFIHTFSSSFLSFVLSRFSQRPTPSPFSVRQTIIFPDFPPGILISCAGKERQGLIDAEIAPSSRDNVPGSNRQPKQAWVISRRANYCVERVWI